MSLFSRLFGGKDNALRDAEVIYSKLMVHARQPGFYGESRFPDNYDGRIDVLTLHIAVILEALREHGEQGNRLSQALFDYMKDDFEVALREQGLSDTGVAKRIKPMIRLFYTRVKDYTQSLIDQNISEVANAMYKERDQSFTDMFQEKLDTYSTQLQANLSNKTLGDIAQGNFEIPKI